ncbi:MAG: type II toxin-antitoxin system PemK/MazF family toxin [Actinomycetia bacterium]|nr:type II toxin-antitoxin system PemK/MazF family toxin [Actinomycetes bacterium]
MRRRIIDQLIDLLRPPAKRKAPRTDRKKPPVKPPVAPTTRSRDGVVIEYSPNIDGDPDPGEVVWTWVPYEDDPSQGKDRPVVIIGRHGKYLAAVPLTSKRHDNELQVAVGTGPWDREGRTSYAKVERVLDVDPNQVRREGAILQRKHFDAVVEGVRRAQQR